MFTPAGDIRLALNLRPRQSAGRQELVEDCGDQPDCGHAVTSDSFGGGFVAGPSRQKRHGCAGAQWREDLPDRSVERQRAVVQNDFVPETRERGLLPGYVVGHS